MRLLVSDRGIYAEIYRVNFYKSRHWSVIGEQLLFDYLEALIPHGTDFHSHFIYIENGDYHYSIKYFDTVENLYIDRKTYYNHIAVRKNASPNFTLDVPIERRDINLDDPLDSFMMGEKLKPWTDRPLGHQFGTVVLNLAAGKQNHLPWDNTITVSVDDIVIDLNYNTNKIVNLSVALFNEANPLFDLSTVPKDVIKIEKSIYKDDLTLRFSVIIV